MSLVTLSTGKQLRSTKPVLKKEVVSVLLKLSRQGRADELREFINEYAAVIKYIINKTDNSKLAALHYAARNEAIDCVRILIEEGQADVNVKTDEQSTPLHFAARYRRQSDKPTTEFIGTTPYRRNPTTFEVDENGKHCESEALDETEQQSATDEHSHSPPRVPLLDSDGSPTVVKKAVIYDKVIHYLVQHGAQLNGQDANGWTALHYAAIRGNEVATRQLLQEPGVNIELEDHDGMRPLHLAISHNETEITRCLLRMSADPFAVTQRGCLPIHFACATGNVELVELLLSYCGTEEDCTNTLNTVNRDGESPLHWAVVNGHGEVVKFCLEKQNVVQLSTNANPNLTAFTGETSLHMAARVGSVNIARMLIAVGVHINAEDVTLQTAIHKAAERNNCEVLKLLIKKGGDMENEDDSASTALLLAVSKGHTETVQLLLENGANLFAQDKNAKTVIYLCAEENQLDVLRMVLMNKKAKKLINVPNIYGNTPLHVASKLGHLEIVKLLVENGADLSAKNERERLAFHYAAKHGRLHITRLFLRKSPGIVSELDEDGNSAIHLAAGRGHKNVTDLLLKYGAAVDSRNSLRWTPLDCAAANGHRACAEFLLENDSPVDPRDVSNTTPLHLACKHGHVHMVELLLAWGADPGVRMVLNENLPGCGPNALDSAIDHGQKSCALVLLQSFHWKRALRNQTIGPDGIITTPMRKLIIQMPDLAEYVLDRCYTHDSNALDENGYNVVQYNFEFIEDTYASWSSQAILHMDEPKNSTTALSAMSKTDKSHLQFNSTLNEDEVNLHGDVNIRPYTWNSRILKKNHPLMLMIKYKRAHLLEHRIVEMLLKRKWIRTGMVYYINLLIYGLFLAFYSTYMLTTKSGDLVLKKDSNLANVTLIDACSKGWLPAQSQSVLSTILISKYVVLSLAVLNLAKEVAQLVFTGFRYFTLENFMEFSIFVLAIISVVDADACVSPSGLKISWQWQCGTVGVFLAWLNLLLFLRRIPTLGLFVLMFTVIIKTFTKFSAVFFLFIFAFAFGFHMLLSNHTQFNSLSNSLIKTSVMTLGEFEFDSVFNAQFESPSYENEIIFAGVTYALFVTFMIVMTLVIMNLLIGLAVDDIKGVQNQAVVKRLAMQIELLLDIDSLLPHWIRKRFEQRQVYLRKFWRGSCSTQSAKRCFNLFRHQLQESFSSSDENQTEEEVHVVQRRLNEIDQRLNEVQSNQKLVMNSLNQVLNSLRQLHGPSLSPNDTNDLEAITVRRGSLLTYHQDYSPREIRRS